MSLASEVPRQLGDLELIDSLGAGSMASLHLARRVGPGEFRRLVAVKVLHGHLSEDRRVVRYFEAEARIAAQIRHPNVVSVEATGRQGPWRYLVMEYVAGGTVGRMLARCLRLDRAVPADIACWIAACVADGLDAAHRAVDEESGAPLGIIHRDISPMNILLSSEGHVRLTDFGVAKTSSSATTSAGALRGKLAYMAPEQLEGRPIDPRADVYALGVVLWEMLTGQRFGRSSDLAAALAEARAPARAPSTLRKLPNGLDAVVARALSPDPERRFKSAGALRDSLIGFASPRGSHALHRFLLELSEETPASAPAKTHEAPTVLTGELELEPEPEPQTEAGGGFFDLPTAPLMSLEGSATVATPGSASTRAALNATGRPSAPAVFVAPKKTRLGTGIALVALGAMFGVLGMAVASSSFGGNAVDEAQRALTSATEEPAPSALPAPASERRADPLEPGTHQLEVEWTYPVGDGSIALEDDALRVDDAEGTRWVSPGERFEVDGFRGRFRPAGRVTLRRRPGGR